MERANLLTGLVRKERHFSSFVHMENFQPACGATFVPKGFRNITRSRFVYRTAKGSIVDLSVKILDFICLIKAVHCIDWRRDSLNSLDAFDLMFLFSLKQGLTTKRILNGE